MALEALEEIGGRFWSEFVVSETDSNRTSCEIKSVHFLKSLTSLIWITESAVLLAEINELRFHDLLHKPIASASPTLFLLQLNKFELAERFKDILQILLGDTEMDVAHVETMERYRAVVAARCFRVSGLPIFLCFGELCNDWNAEKLLSSKLNRERDGLFLPKLNIADTSTS